MSATAVPQETATAPGPTVARRAAALLRGPLGAPLLLGVVGMLLIALASPGAGSLRVNDPLLQAWHLSWMRYGHGQQLSMIVIYSGVGVVLLAWVRVGRLALAGRAGVRALGVTVAAWVAPLLVASPIYSRDVYSYLAQGALLRDGFDPYAVGPAVNPQPAAGRRQLHLVDHPRALRTGVPAARRRESPT